MQAKTVTYQVYSIKKEGNQFRKDEGRSKCSGKQPVDTTDTLQTLQTLNLSFSYLPNNL